jgi:hypothetical protein
MASGPLLEKSPVGLSPQRAGVSLVTNRPKLKGKCNAFSNYQHYRCSGITCGHSKCFGMRRLSCCGHPRQIGCAKHRSW